MTLNEANLVGRVHTEPKEYENKNGFKHASFRLLTWRYRKDNRTGETIKDSQLHSIVLFEEAAKYFLNNISEGSLVMVKNGEIRYERWTNQKGEERRGTKIYSSSVINLEEVK